MWIKICGVRTVEDAMMVQLARPDAVGLNFHPPSKRYVTLDVAREIGAVIKGNAEVVGVFVNRSAAEIGEICRTCGISTVQLHGDEPPELAAELAEEFRIIRAFRVQEDRGLEPVARELDRYRRLGIPLRACLVDAFVPGAYGGTGQPPPWDVLAAEWNFGSWPPLILAGGLRPENVAEAIAAVAPWGVDVAGGVENNSGFKDPVLVQSFVQNARQAGNMRHAQGTSANS